MNDAVNRIASCRAGIYLKYKDMANLLNISITAYRNKEKGFTPFTDKEKIVLVDFFKKYYSDISVEKLFF